MYLLRVGRSIALNWNRQEQTNFGTLSEINKHGPEETLKKCKGKIRNLRDCYKKAKESNKKSGASPPFPPFYQNFDEIFSTRDIIGIPSFVEMGVLLSKEEGENVSLESEQSFTDKSSSDVNDTP